jgi:hypothetical protein
LAAHGVMGLPAQGIVDRRRTGHGEYPGKNYSHGNHESSDDLEDTSRNLVLIEGDA